MQPKLFYPKCIHAIWCKLRSLRSKRLLCMPTYCCLHPTKWKIYSVLADTQQVHATEPNLSKTKLLWVLGTSRSGDLPFGCLLGLLAPAWGTILCPSCIEKPGCSPGYWAKVLDTLFNGWVCNYGLASIVLYFVLFYLVIFCFLF